MIELVIKSDDGFWSNDCGWVSLWGADGYFEDDINADWFRLPIGKNVQLVLRSVEESIITFKNKYNRIIDGASRYYIKKSEKYADYSIHDAICEASNRLHVDLPEDDSEYDDIVFYTKQKLCIND